MDDLKKLYVLLAVLIVIYVGVNFSYNGLDTINSLSHVNLDVGIGMDNGNEGDTIKIGSSSFTKLENFNVKKINDNEVRLIDNKNEIYIKVREYVDGENITNKVNNLLSTDENITSNQTIIQNGITAYFLYEEKQETYNADICFNKDNKNYLISADNITYENSDYFINKCKDIINSMKSENGINFSKY